MGSFYRRAEEVRLEISEGNWLLVRKHLTAGEERKAGERIIKVGTFKPGAPPDLDMEQVGLAEAYAYLIDWSITDVDDRPVPIRGKPYEFVASALKDMDPEGCKEILVAIDKHDRAMRELRDQEKKRPVGVSGPSLISTSAE